MGSVLLGARVLLAAVFATAGIAKLLDRPGSRQALSGFGVPRRFVAAGAILLPVAELGTAAALLPTPTAQWGGLVALLLLLAFAAGIGNAMRQGKAPDCHCFGQLSSAPAGRSTLLRNLALAVPAAYVAIDGPGPSLTAWIADRSAAELVAVAAGIAAAVLGALAAHFWRESQALARQLDAARDRIDALPSGLPVGAAAPSFTVRSARSGEAVTSDALLARERPIVLIFVSPQCSSCGAILAHSGRWQVALASDVTIAVLSYGGAAENMAALQNGSGDILLQDNWEVAENYKVKITPTAVAISPDGRVASPLAAGDAIEPLIRLTARQYGTRRAAATLPGESVA